MANIFADFFYTDSHFFVDKVFGTFRSVFGTRFLFYHTRYFVLAVHAAHEERQSLNKTGPCQLLKIENKNSECGNSFRPGGKNLCPQNDPLPFGIIIVLL